jgi:hypothetical protein
MGWHPRPSADALPLAGPLWFYVQWFKAPLQLIPLPVFWFNHTVIHTSQGPLVLVIPLCRETSPAKGLPCTVKWADHWLKSLRTAYGKAPYFEELFAELEVVLKEGAQGPLITLSHRLHSLLTRWLLAEDLPSPRCVWVDKKGAPGNTILPENQIHTSGSSKPLTFLNPTLSVWHMLMYYGREVRLYLLEGHV